MWIVRIALERPYTFVVLALLILILGPLSIMRTPKDIFPSIDIPVVGVVWSFTGLPPDQMSNYIVSGYERALTTTVNDIEHIESQTLTGVAVVKIYFQPNANIQTALAQVTAISQTVLRSMPPGTTPPLVLSYNASSVPIMQLALSSSQLSEQELFDAGNNFIRTQLATVQGAALPFPYGGKVRQIQVDLDQKRMQGLGISAQDVNAAIGSQNLIIPAGTEKIGSIEYNIKLNASPTAADELNDMPIKAVRGTTIYVRDVAHVRDGFAPQTNIVRVDGQRAALMTVLKTGNASTLDIIGRVKKVLPNISASLPPSLQLHPIGDQSVFVRAAITGVVREGVIAAALTGLMILLFLGSWRSTIIIVVSIPLSILVSILMLSALGQTINIMTLGGLALAVGILVDDATVAIENINWHLEQGKEVVDAILDGAKQIAVPALVSTLCICIVFIPMFFLTGVARYLFVPMAEAVIFAMLASYVLSRTLVPTMAKFLLHKHEERAQETGHGPIRYMKRIQQGFENWFTGFRDGYSQNLSGVLERRGIFIILFMAFVLISLGVLGPWLGSDFFPSIDAGQIKLHLRASPGTRVEDTAAICDQVTSTIRRVIPKEELQSVVSNVGLPNSGINLTYSNSAPIGPEDADIYISLNEDHKPTADYVRHLRTELMHDMPGISFSFLPADITSQILNFGLPSPIDVQVIGSNKAANRTLAENLLAKIQKIPGVVDAHIQQTDSAPEFHVTVNRTRTEELGITQRDVATNMLISLSGSFQTSPTFWVDPKNGVAYNIVTQTPQYDLTSLEDLRNIPVTAAVGSSSPQILGALATIERGAGPAVISHYNVQPVIDIFAAAQDRDMGAIASDVNHIIESMQKDMPKGTRIVARGQMKTMSDSFTGLFFGLLGAIVLIYFLIVVNFQSWTDPFIIITALPGALCGIIWMLFITGTTLNVPSLMGAIMAIGVATANSILLVTFANEKRTEGKDAMEAALSAGYTRLRPVLMTALAMIIGMLPMSLGLGEGGEQNAPLGRAVIGGLMIATVATLFFVPVIYSLLRTKPYEGDPDERFEKERDREYKERPV
jgi:CzcA family heavy metal efflux pump